MPPAKRSPKKSPKKKEEKEEEQVHQWWKENEGDSKKKWTTLEHNGVFFPPEYVPHGIPVKYDGKTIKMTPEEEEVATMFAVMREQTKPPSDYYVNPIFRENFFKDWKLILNHDPNLNKKRFSSPVHPITNLEKVNFDNIWEWHLKEKEKKKNLSREEKAQQKAERDKIEEPYKYCMWDGRKQAVGNFRLEPPSLFRGRGKHPKMGVLKKRLKANDIIINITKGAKPPVPPKGQKWKEIRHDNEVTWLAAWIENVNDARKYVMLASESAVKGRADLQKFEKAKSVDSIIDKFRTQYLKDMKSGSLQDKQRAVVLYFIDKLALRVGNEKGEDQAETYGACSLKVDHVTMEGDNMVVFDFLGKDSIRYHNSVKVIPEAFQLLKQFVQNKTPESDLFDQVNPNVINKYLKEQVMSGLSAKVFRTYNASKTLDRYFQENPCPSKATLQQKVAYFTKANTEVAVLCNHQKSVSRAHSKQMKELDYKLECLEAVEKRCQACIKLEKKGDVDAAKELWEDEEAEVQGEWLEKYGTEEDRKEAKSGTKKRKSVPKKKREAPKKKSASRSKPKSRRKKEESSEEDEPESESEEKPKKKKATKRKREAEVEPDSDEEKPKKKKVKRIVVVKKVVVKKKKRSKVEE